jgi:paraquat-inducible protein B
MRARPAVVGGFILGALGLVVAGILFFGGEELFATRSRVVVFFSESVAGLDVGAPVTFHGVRIGSVQSIAIQFSTGTMTARIPVLLEINPKQITWEGKKLSGSAADYQRLVESGLRAQLALQSIVTGQLRVDLEFQPGMPAQLVGATPNVPEIPTIPSELGQLRDQLTNLPLRPLADTARRALISVGRLSDDLDKKLDPLIDSAHRTADAATRTLETTDETVRRVQSDASAALHDLDSLLIDSRRQVNARGDELSRTLMASDRAVRQAETLLESLNGLAEPGSPFRGDLEAAMRDLAAGAGSLRSFGATVERNPNVLLMGRASR